MIDRILFIQAIEAIYCVEEGVVRSTTNANLGAILALAGALYPSIMDRSNL